MLSHILRSSRSRSRLFSLFACASVLSLALGCDKVPLLAPSGSVITIFPTATTVPTNGQVDIIATVIENGVATAPTPNPGTGGGTGTGTGTTATSTTGAGTPVQNGTLVTFTTTLGRIEPAEARTNNGQVRVTFHAGGQSGTATITAFSGGASGKIENLRVGSAAAERVLITAAPQTLSPAGGTTTIAARVEDTSGAGLPGVPVNFVADAGTLTATSVVTDSEGVARTQLTTSRQTKVTANVAGKTAEVTVNLNPRTGISITPPTNQVSAGVPATFTVNVGSNANVQNVVIDWGDGRRQELGALSGSTPVTHTYETEGTYTVRATAVEASGFTESVATVVSILPGQPPSVIVNVSDQTPTVGETVTVTATVSGNTSSIVRYEWNFGSGAVPQSATTTGNRIAVTWTTPGTKTITVNVVQASGPSGDGLTAVVVTP